MRQTLAEQLKNKQDNRDSELRKDQAIIDEANRMAQKEKDKLKQKQEVLKKKLQEMNEERGKHLQEKADAFENYK